MKCPYCNSEVPDGSVFCDKCGQFVQSDKQTDLDSDKYWEKENLEKQKEVSRVREMQATQKERKKRQKKTALASLIGLAVLVAIIVYSIVFVPQIRYNNGLELLENGNYEEARSIFVKLGNYENAEDLILQCDAGITENNYQDALQVFNSGDYATALQKFVNLKDYAESQQYALDCEIQLLSNATVNETVVYGAYNWTVLTKSDSDILLVSESYVAHKIANEYDIGQYGKYRCWSESTLRTWLNSSFISEVFSSAEEKLLFKNSISTPEFDVSGYDGWSEEEITVTTVDKVYIPSKDDVERYNIQPIKQKTTNNYYDNNDESAGWLRDRGHGIAFQSTLNSDGSYGSEWHFYSSYGIRPIIRVSLTGSTTTVVDTGDYENTEASSSNTERHIPDNALSWNNHYYAIFDNCTTWEEAEEYCESLGGHLATITSSEENSAVFSYMQSNSCQSAYFGLSDNKNEGNWYWVTGEKLNYTNWHSNEPNAESSGEDYVMYYYKYDDGSWNDGDFGGSTVNGGVAFICEWE